MAAKHDVLVLAYVQLLSKINHFLSKKIWTNVQIGLDLSKIKFMNQQELIDFLDNLDVPVYKIEADLGMPSGTLAKAKKGVRGLPKKWEGVLRSYNPNPKEEKGQTFSLSESEFYVPKDKSETEPPPTFHYISNGDIDEIKVSEFAEYSEKYAQKMAIKYEKILEQLQELVLKKGSEVPPPTAFDGGKVDVIKYDEAGLWAEPKPANDTISALASELGLKRGSEIEPPKNKVSPVEFLDAEYLQKVKEAFPEPFTATSLDAFIAVKGRIPDAEVPKAESKPILPDWAAKIETYCNEAGITPEELIAAHKTPKKTAKEKKVEDKGNNQSSSSVYDRRKNKLGF